MKQVLLVAPRDGVPLVHALAEYVAVTATTLAEALPLVADKELVLVHQNLPDAEGLTPVLHLREAAPTTALVVLTESSNARLDRKLLRAGADLVLSDKVTDLELLRRSVEQALERRKLLVALHRSRQGVDAIVEQSPDGIAVLRRGRVSYINPRGYEWLGWRRGEVVEKPEDGSLIQVRDRYLELRSSTTSWGGNPATLVLARDVTKRQRSERALRSREHQLRKAENLRSLGQLAAGLAHEFNNILTTILGHADLLGMKPENLEHAEAIRGAGERMGMLVRQMMVFSGHRHHRCEPQRLNATVADSVQVVRNTLPETAVLELELDHDVDSVVCVRGDLERMVIAVGDNARRAAGEHGTLRISTRLAGPDRALLVIEDDGPGIPDAVLPRIFEPFFTTREVGEGAGLGLTAVYAMVKHAEGGIQVDRSAALGGTRVRIMLPHVRVEDSESLEDQPSEPPPSTVLFAEDDTALRNMGRLLLQLAGYRVLVAEDGSQALQYMDGDRVDLLVTDVRMPGIEGPALAARLRQRWPGMRVLYMSGYADVEVPADPLSSYLEKPFEAEVLVQEVRRLLKLSPDAG